MLAIRLKRTGRRNNPHFRIIVTEKGRGPKTGKYVEEVGTWNPQSKNRVLKTDRVEYWLSVGAKPSDTVHNMLVDEGLINDEKINVLPQKSPVVSEEDEQDDGESKEDEVSEESSEETADADSEAEGDVTEDQETPDEPSSPEEE